MFVFCFPVNFSFSATLPERSKSELCNPPTESEKLQRNSIYREYLWCCIRQTSPLNKSQNQKKSKVAVAGIEPTISVSQASTLTTTPTPLAPVKKYLMNIKFFIK